MRSLLCCLDTWGASKQGRGVEQTPRPNTQGKRVVGRVGAMLRSAAGKVMWVGRAKVFVVGLAVILALSMGLASTALAGTGVGARFQLGQTNTVNAITKLVGSVVGPSR